MNKYHSSQLWATGQIDMSAVRETCPTRRFRVVYAAVVGVYSIACIGILSVSTIPVGVRIGSLVLLFFMWTLLVGMPRPRHTSELEMVPAQAASTDTLPIYEPPVPKYEPQVPET